MKPLGVSEDHGDEPVPVGTCPLCRSVIDFAHSPRGMKFECPNCHRLIQTTRAFNALKLTVCLGLAAAICWKLSLSWFISIVLWLAFAFILDVIYITISAFVWIPTYVEYHLKTKDEPFQKLGLDK